MMSTVCKRLSGDPYSVRHQPSSKAVVIPGAAAVTRAPRPIVRPHGPQYGTKTEMG